MRHAKSSWEDNNLDDLQRPIISKGIKRTKRIAEFMNQNQIIPDEVWVSPAKRAMETANIVHEELKMTFAPKSKKHSRL